MAQGASQGWPCGTSEILPFKGSVIDCGSEGYVLEQGNRGLTESCWPCLVLSLEGLQGPVWAWKSRNHRLHRKEAGDKGKGTRASVRTERKERKSTITINGLAAQGMKLVLSAGGALILEAQLRW